MYPSLAATWSNWRESRPRAVLDLGWQTMQEVYATSPAPVPANADSSGMAVQGAAARMSSILVFAQLQILT